MNGFCSFDFRLPTFSKLAYPLSANKWAVNDTDAFLDIASFLKYSAEVLYFDTKSLSFGSPVPPQSTAVYSFHLNFTGNIKEVHPAVWPGVSNMVMLVSPNFIISLS